MRPTSRRERPAKPALTHEGIVAAALRVLRDEGLHKVTMRRLAQELDTGAASLYVYVRDTDELHAAMLDVLLGDVDLRGGDGPWRERLWHLISAYTRTLYAQPGLARVALVTRLSGPHYLALLDTALGLLLEGGADRARASWAVDALLLHATATAAEHGTRAGTPNAEQQHDTLVARLAAIPAERYPHLAAAGGELVSGTGDDRSRWAFDALVTGVLSTPTTGRP